MQVARFIAWAMQFGSCVAVLRGFVLPPFSGYKNLCTWRHISENRMSACWREKLKSKLFNDVFSAFIWCSFQWLNDELQEDGRKWWWPILRYGDLRMLGQTVWGRGEADACGPPSSHSLDMYFWMLQHLHNGRVNNAATFRSSRVTVHSHSILFNICSVQRISAVPPPCI